MLKSLYQRVNPFSVFIIFLFLLLPFTESLTQPTNNQPPTTKELILQGIDAGIRENYELAENIFTRIISAEPENPEGYFFLGACYQTQMIDLESDFKEEEFYHNMEKSIELSKKRIEKDGNDIWAHFYLGNAYGSMAVYDAKHKRWWSGLKKGLKAKSAFKKVVELNSTFYDAYLGLGSYHYWVSVVTKSLRWLPFLRDDREKGIEEVKLAAEKSLYTKESALYSLIYVYLEEKEYDKAINLAMEMNQRFPESKLFLWPLADALYMKRDWENCIRHYEKILKLISNPDPSGYFNTIECRHRMAECYFHLELYDKCKEECERVLSYQISEDVKKRLKKELKDTKNLLEKCEER
jgi:tetratricopeptide (TPR) repeat protein